MRKFRWRDVAYGVAAASLCFTVAACDDDNGGQDMGQDMSMPDMTQGDMAGGPDMASTPGTAQVFVGDLQGTLWAGASPTPAVHVLKTVTSFPEVFVDPQFIDADAALGASHIGAQHGCLANRYNFTTTIPQADSNVGAVTFTGYNATTSVAFVPPSATPFMPPQPATIVCGWGGQTAPFYACFFGTPGADGGTSSIDGESVGSVIFPPLPGPTIQHLFDPTGISTVTINVMGAQSGSTYTAASTATIGTGAAGSGPPAALTIISVSVAGTPVTDTLGTGSLLDNMPPLDGTQDVLITYSCDGSATAGSGCSGNPFDVVLTVITTQLNAKGAAPAAPGSPFGLISCFDQANKGATSPFGKGVIGVHKEAIAAAFGANPTMASNNGAYNIALIHVKGSPSASGNHTVFFGAGQGNFGFNNQQ
jgi:hypothetical protein